MGKKVGYYCLNKIKIKADDWILIVDESIGIGQEKLLVVLGIRSSQIDFTRPLRIQDMEPIIVKSSKKWTGEAIHKELEISKQLVGNVIYATTDGGGTIKKGLKLSEIRHVYDLTHAIAIMLEKIYKEDVDFKELTHLMGQMRLKLCCSEHAHIIPPNQRSKSRFLNINILARWGMQVLKALDNNGLTEKEIELLKWIGDKKLFIEEMNQIIEVVEEVSKTLKNNGLSKKTKRQCCKHLKTCNKTARQKHFKKMFGEYLDTNSGQISKINKILIMLV